MKHIGLFEMLINHILPTRPPHNCQAKLFEFMERPDFFYTPSTFLPDYLIILDVKQIEHR